MILCLNGHRVRADEIAHYRIENGHVEVHLKSGYLIRWIATEPVDACSVPAMLAWLDSKLGQPTHFKRSPSQNQ